MCATSWALVLSSMSAARAADGAAEEEASNLTLIESVTGTDDLLNVMPGDNSEQVYLPEDGQDLASVSGDDSSISFRQPVAAGALTQVSGEGTASYISEDAEYDVHLQAVESPDPRVLSDGLRSLIEIQSASAPTEYAYPVRLDDGAVLSVQPDGSVLGTKDGDIVLIVPAPWAIDEAGTAVPTSYEVRGSDLIQHVNFDSTHRFPIIADPVWFVPLIIAGGRIIGQVAINAATRAAAQRAAAAIAARTIIKSVSGRVSRKALRDCGLGAAVTGGATAIATHLRQRGDGRWLVRLNGWHGTVAASVGGCLATRIGK
ncbi:hypothetical protein D9V32_07170 [Mycetocola tolaasinivorans]|uniref:Uncharacterized protein n=1 Tax=Mycetocola tolaasinivorans TaxID=76635 RepID=A0A3L7A6Z8_9MICO|nr:hypothetical protein D9V32_07170 [Mycetocola tolaasinivorans]